MQLKAKRDTQRSRRKQSHDPRGDTLAFCVLMSIADGWTRIAVVEEGVPAHVVEDLAALMDVPAGYLARSLAISTSTLRTHKRDSKPLPVGSSDRVVGMACLIGCAALIVQESGGPGDFDTARWIATWLRGPLPALGGRHPEEFLSTRSGLTLIEDLLERTRSGAYS